MTMTATIKNLIEVQEADSSYGEALKVRRRNINKFSTLGPPDLCYLTKTNSKSFGLTKGSSTIGSYHYAYGVDMSSPACIGIYINNLLKNQEIESGWFAKGNWQIKKAVYCVYDAFTKLDIRAEFFIPGSMRLYAVNKDEQSIAIDGSEWDTVFISAMLRAFNPEKVPFTRYYRELATMDQLREFLKTVSEFTSKEDGLKDLRFENDELITFRGNRVLHYVSDYLIRKKRLSVALEFFTSLTRKDKKCAAFIVDVFSCMYKYPDSVRLLAPILQKNPHISILLYQEADSLMKAEKYELALKIAKVVIQLCPDSFDAWFLLAEILFYSKHYNQALVALNICPFYSREHNNDGISLSKSHHVVTPKVHDLCNSYSQYMFEPNWEIYTPTQFNEEIAKLSQNFIEENERILQHLKNLPGCKFNPNELKAYKLIVKIEREIGWETLLKIRSTLFIMDNDKDSKSPALANEEVSRLEDYNIHEKSDIQIRPDVNFVPGLSMNEQSFHMVKLGGEAFIGKYKEEFETLESVGHDDMPSFLQDDDPDYRTGKSPGQAYRKVRDPGPDEASRIEQKSDDEEDEDLDSEESNRPNRFGKFGSKDESQYRNGARFDPLKIINLEVRNKRLCSRMLESLFVALYEDLTMLYEWQHEENLDQSVLHGENDKRRKEDDDKLKYTGMVWVHRGILAERLCRISFAEKAYRKVIDKAISLYALGRLFKLYLDSGNVKASLLCFGEIIEEMEVDGIKKFEFLPNWLEEPLLQIISTIGMEKFKLVVKEANLSEEEAIKLLIKHSEYWRVSNTD